MKKSLLLFCFACVFGIPASPQAKSEPMIRQLEGRLSQVSPLVDGNNQFTWSFFQQLRDEEGNFFISPYNMTSALSMAYVGARGETANQMQSVLHYPEDPEQVLARDFSVLNSLLALKGERVTLNLADGIWLSQDMTITAEYRQIIADAYGGDLFLTNFRFPKAAADQINAFVKGETQGHIADLLRPGDVDAATQMVIASALYMKAPWAKAFDPRQTQGDTFTTLDGRWVTVPFMRQTGIYPYAKGDGYSMLAIPYVFDRGGAELVMVIALPDEEEGLPELLDTLTLEQLETDMAGMERTSVKLALPLFSVKTRVAAKDLLRKLGMPLAFSGQADFSGINGRHNLSITSALHQTTFDVNEYGTEASAASAVSIGMTSVRIEEPPINFVVDRPFMAYVLDLRSGQILFVGQVVDPSDSK